jgi:hypothetical protein
LVAQLNNKMDGDLAKIKIVGQYMIEMEASVDIMSGRVRVGVGGRVRVRG